MKTKITVTKEGEQSKSPQWNDLPNGVSFVEIDVLDGNGDRVVIRDDDTFHISRLDGSACPGSFGANILRPLLHVYSSANIQLVK